MQNTFLFYDLETSGLDSRTDRIMQFAGQRTDLDLIPIGKPINLLIKLTDDTLPSPQAILVTKITPQKTQADGIAEAEFCKYITKEVFTPGTIATGYNSVRFDDEFMRHLFWRNFHDPYEWQWRDGRSRWDLLDVVRLTRALRPEGINWPSDKDGKSTNRLELLTKLNHLDHTSAHDALSDVTATIAVAKLIKQKQPKLFDYLLKMRDKKQVQKLVNLQNPQPFVYASGRLASEHEKTSIFYPLAPAPNGNVIVYDLRHDPKELLRTGGRSLDDSSDGHIFSPVKKSGLPSAGELSERSEFSTVHGAKKTFLHTRAKDRPSNCHPDFFPHLKELKYNRCPAVAPLSVLNQQNGWQKIHLSREQIEKNLQTLLKNPTLAEQIRTSYEEKPEFPPALDPESALYESFLDHADRVRCDAVKSAKPNDLADFHPEFLDPRLPDLLTHFKARNFPTTLSEQEQQQWETYRAKRLKTQTPAFVKALEDLSATNQDPFILEELRLWHQSLLP